MADNDNHLLRWLQVQTLWTKIKNLVNAETTRATKAEAAIDGTITALTAAVSAEQTRAEKKEKENADAITAEANRATAKESELAATIKTNADTARTYTDTTAETTLTTAKTYADNVAKGAMVWLGTKTWAELQTITDARKGDFYTISDKQSKEFAWDGEQWQDIGADVDFSKIQTDINSRAKASDVYTKTEINNKGFLTSVADGSITSAKLATNAVTTAKIYNGNVTSDKLASNSVTTSKITDGNVTEAKLDSNLQTKINRKADATNVYTKSDIDGKITYITDTMINDLS